MIKIFLLVLALIAPTSLIYLNLTSSSVNHRLLFNLFIIIIIAERVWETFFTPKEDNKLSHKDDWTLPLTLSAYLIVGLAVTFEFFLINREINVLLSVAGIFLLIFAGYIRFLSIKSLGVGWSLHAVGKNKSRSEDHKLIVSGPYSYARHPIYFATIIELIGLSIAFNTFFSGLLVIAVMPLYLIRAHYEEKKLIEFFGEDYLIYKKEVPFIIPIKFRK
ncbi:hypothetical protein COV24_03845 [candidate division WWE3 bacterium CG10_big_fil_rev_8_21_14_0_10_32_10]|uniref:Isoprenylcysteine carboxylmethyltransferase family protein n=1 Tax=candidate division WWE3 bacterium CG10_big_fil_rev_8_21_14_0_10_32_10 TaxID=1975090 RepID=A0A2H0RA51_UNCKA|nr:MAG: hypothetical protein COV24_03845 [candidate division WWE3 bacterium CG10_big_fil_rev_8_21_14_0_10_32_10]